MNTGVEERVTAVFLVSIVAGIAGLLLAFVVPWPQAFDAFRGGKAPVEVFSNVVGPLGAIAAFVALFINFRAARRTMAQTVRSDRATRFQRAAELLAKGNEAAHAAGIALMEQVAFEEPDTYAKPAVRSLAAFVIQTDRERLTETRNALRERAADNLLPYSSPTTSGAANTAARITRQLSLVFDDGRPITINSLVVSRWSGIKIDSRGINLRAGLIHNSKIENGIFDGSTIHMMVGRRVRFANCSFKGTTLILYRDRVDDESDPPTLEPRSRGIVSFVDCPETSGATINGRPLAEWIQEADASRGKPRGK